MKKIYRRPSDLNSVPNGMWKSYVLDLMKHGPIEADLETGAVHQVGEFLSWYRDGVLYGGTDGHRLSDDEICALQAGQLRTDDVLIPTEVIDPPSKKTQQQVAPPAKRPVSTMHQAMRAAVAARVLAEGPLIDAEKRYQDALWKMSPSQRRKYLSGGGR